MWFRLSKDLFESDVHCVQSVIFSRVLLVNANPYSKSAMMFVTRLHYNQSTETGNCHVVLRALPTDVSSSIGNPFKSVHAACIALLGETCCGLALFTTLDRKSRCIVSQLNTEYYAKSRGIVHAVCSVKKLQQSGQLEVVCVITSQSRESDVQQKVAKCTTVWELKVDQ
ncbi:hypothetical protein MIR68_002361 [Amoeboaphelidium protococcarum]|nr:hypothetical protein MIR68_002361 [Amoeboaphelidium protococcarum]